jgi:hypothetical protein
MGRYRTRAGVVIEMSDDAARRVGYEAVDTEPQKKPRATRGRQKKADDKPADEDD